MEGNYEILRDGIPVGTACIAAEGLYYRIRCLCQIHPGERIHLQISCGTSCVDLGLCVPMEGGYGMETRIPAKRFAAGIPQFFLGEQQNPLPEETEPYVPADNKEYRIPVDPEVPFMHLQELENAVLDCSGSVQEIVLTAPAPDQPGNDPNP